MSGHPKDHRSAAAAKTAVNRSFETTLAEGIRYERLSFMSRFASRDRAEGMAAFVEKRPPRYVAHRPDRTRG